MTTAVAEPTADNVKIGEIVIKYEPISFGIADAKLAQLKAEYANLKADSKEGYESVRLAIANCRHHRVSVEETRVRLKAPALAYGRQCDSEAARITAELESIEKPLQKSKDAADAEAARVKKAKMDEIQRKLDEAAAIKRAAEDAKLKAERDAEEARLKAEAERLAEERRQLEIERAAQEAAAQAERDKLAEERRAEEARQTAARAAQEAIDKAERDRIEAEQLAERQRIAEEQRIERERLAEERRILDAERAKQAAEEASRVAAAKAAQEAAERAERAKIAAEQQAKREAELAALREAMRPDVEKIQAWVDSIKAIQLPQIEAASLRVAAGSTEREIRRLLDNMILVISE